MITCRFPATAASTQTTGSSLTTARVVSRSTVGRAARTRSPASSTTRFFDGYPRLSGTWGGKSLRYLFDSSAQTGKTSHFGVTGLLQAQGGYYVYDSTHNYAAYNANKNAFDIYDTGGVGNSSHQVSSSRSTRQTRCSMRKTTGSSKMASRQTTPRATTVASPSTITSVSQCPRDS